jgi:hypothetical protein
VLFKDGLCYEMHLSDKFEPFAILVVIHPDEGKVRTHTDTVTALRTLTYT